MARVFMRIRLPDTPTAGRTRESIEKFMGLAFRFAVRSALQSNLGQIRILSGMARGTFLHLSKFVKAGLNFPSNPGFKYYHRKGGGGQKKTAALGASYSTVRSQNDARSKFKSKGTRYTFEMQTALRYFNIEDQVRWGFSDAFVHTMEIKLEEYILRNGQDLINDIFVSATRGRGRR